VSESVLRIGLSNSAFQRCSRRKGWLDRTKYVLWNWLTATRTSTRSIASTTAASAGSHYQGRRWSGRATRSPGPRTRRRRTTSGCSPGRRPRRRRPLGGSLGTVAGVVVGLDRHKADNCIAARDVPVYVADWMTGVAGRIDAPERFRLAARLDSEVPGVSGSATRLDPRGRRSASSTARR